MGKKGGSAPQSPDPIATANAQAAANKEAVYESARVNQINELSPYGSVSWSGDIGDPNRTRTIALSDSGQSQLDQQNQLAELLGASAVNRAGQISNDPFQIQSTLPKVGDVSDYEQAQFNRAMELMRPELDRQERRFEQSMADRGIPIGQEAYNDARGQFDKSRDDMLSSAAYQSLAAGRDEQARKFNLGRTEYSDALNRQLMERQQPMNELAAILQGSPALQNPQVQAASQYQLAPADISGNVWNKYNADVNAYNARQQSNNAMLGGLSSLGSAAIGFFSDKRLKKDIKPICSARGYKWYEFSYLWDDVKHIGVMAQDVLKIKPEAVHVLPSGYMVVNYGLL
jgi:hypothetical protein